MSLLSELKTILEARNILVETGVFKNNAPAFYTVLTPMNDDLTAFSDDMPEHELQSVRVSIFDKGNYNATKIALTLAFLAADMTITERRYVGHEDDSGYHHYVIDVEKLYKFELEE